LENGAKGRTMNRRKFLFAGTRLGMALAAGSLLSPKSVLGRAAPSETADTAKTTQNPGRIFITGSSDGLGYLAAESLQAQGHEVIVHVRSQQRMPAVRKLVEKGAVATVGDLSDLAQIHDLARQVNAVGRMDAVIHNAGVFSGPHVLMVNTVAPFLLTALIQRPRRLIYLSSGMHKGGSTDLAGKDWLGRSSAGGYSDSKLYVTTLAAAVARLWPDVFSNAVNPGWVPTKMGGPAAPDDLHLGHATQEWLAVSDEPEAKTSGGYWFHRKREEPHSAVRDVRFQDLLLAELARVTGTRLA